MELSHQKIVAFLKEELPKAEMERINEHLRNDPLDADLVANIADALEAGESIEDLEAKAKAVERSSFRLADQESPSTTSSRRWYWAAAAVLIFSVGMYFLNQKPSKEELYAQYFSPYQDVLTVRGDEETDWTEVMEYYNRGNYEQVSASMEKLDSTAKERPIALLYMGIAQLNNSEVAQAEKTFKKLLSHNESVYLEHGEWYLALTYLRLGALDDATVQLRSLSDSSMFYEERARQLLSAID